MSPREKNNPKSVLLPDTAKAKREAIKARDATGEPGSVGADNFAGKAVLRWTTEPVEQVDTDADTRTIGKVDPKDW